MNFSIQENPTEIKPCIQQVREQIYVDQNGVYQIPTDLKISDYPEAVVNSFLDYLDGFNATMRSQLLEAIQSGEITIECEVVEDSDKSTDLIESESSL